MGWAAQLVTVLICLGALALVPAAGTPILLVPLTASALRRLPAEVLRPGVGLLGRGPFAGSLIVLGADPLPAMFADGIIAVAVPDVACGHLAGAGR